MLFWKLKNNYYLCIVNQLKQKQNGTNGKFNKFTTRFNQWFD